MRSMQALRPRVNSWSGYNAIRGTCYRKVALLVLFAEPDMQPLTRMPVLWLEGMASRDGGMGKKGVLRTSCSRYLPGDRDCID